MNIINYLRLTFRKERTRKQLFSSAIFVFFFLMLGTLFISKTSTDFIQYEMNNDDRNRWPEIVIPNYNDSLEKTQFRYSQILSQADKNCFPRWKYTSDFLRLFNIDPYSCSQGTSFVIVYGANTELGISICKELQRRNVHVIKLNGVADSGLTSIIDVLNKGTINISKAIICFQLPVTRASSSSSVNSDTKRSFYAAKVFSEYFTRVRIPYIIAMQPPYYMDFIQLAEWFEKPLVLVPFLSHFEGTYDVENPLVRAAQECQATGKATIDRFKGYPVSNFNERALASFIIDHDTGDRKSVERIVSRDASTVEEVIKAAYPKCKVRFLSERGIDTKQFSGIKTVEIKSKSNPVDSSVQSAKLYKYPIRTDPYLSIVVACKEKEIEKLNKFLNVMDRSSKYVPLAEYEIIVVDYANSRKLKESINVGDNLKNKVRVVEVDEKFDDRYKKMIKTNNYLINFARNIGIRRARGKFVLVTNVDELIPAAFLENVVGHFFVDGIVYKANRMDFRSSYASQLSFDSMFNQLNQQWEYYDNLDIAPHCFNPYEGSFIITKESDIKKYTLCSTSDFIIASRNMFDAIGGLPETGKYDDLDGDTLASFMKIAPGVVLYYLREQVIHLNEPSEPEIPKIGRPSKYRREMMCHGRTNETNLEISNYGLPNESLPEKIF